MRMDDQQLTFVAGLGSSGSSAVCDVLSEYSGAYAPKEEWRIWVDPHCLLDLARTLQSSDSLFATTTAITEFDSVTKAIYSVGLGRYSHLRLTKGHADCIHSIRERVMSCLIDEEYSGLWYGNSNFFNSKLNFLLGRSFWKSRFINKRMYLCNSKGKIKDFFCELGELVEASLSDLSKANSINHFIVNENFSIFFAEEIFRMHPNAKIILTVRNPLDVYSDSKRVGWLAMPYDIHQFIKWQNSMCSQVREIYLKFPEKIFVQPFETLVSEYERSVGSLSIFLGLDITQHDTKTIFKPEESAVNVEQWKRQDPWLAKYQDQFLMQQNPHWWKSV